MVLARPDSSLSDTSWVSSSCSCPSTECGTSSGSSTSTVPGPGALTGKAVKALGIATLRGLGRIVMAKRLADVTHSFPHTDEEASRIRNIDEIYDDLLEFSRPGMYSDEINGKALVLILAQIGTGQTRHLIRALSRWHPVEMHILLSGILMQLAHLWNPSLRGVFSSPFSYSYASAQWDNESPVLRLILFLSKVIRGGLRACRTVLNVGFLDVLLSLNHYYRFGSVDKSFKGKEGYHLYIACNAALLDVTAYLKCRSLVKDHPIFSIWPVSGVRATDIFPFKIRRTALMLDAETDVAFDDHSPFIGLSLPDVCAQPCVSAVPPAELLKSLTFQVTSDQAVRVFLARSSHKKKVILLSSLLQCLSDAVTDAATDAGARNDHLWRYQFSFSLHFITGVARSSPTNRQALFDAGAVDYLAKSLQIVLPDAYESVTDVIREHGLSGLLMARSMPDPRIQQSMFLAIAALFEDSENC